MKAQAGGQQLGAHAWQHHGDATPPQPLDGARSIDFGPGGHEGRHDAGAGHLRQVEQKVRCRLGHWSTLVCGQLFAPAGHDAPERPLLVAQPEISRAHQHRRLVPAHATQPNAESPRHDLASQGREERGHRLGKVGFRFCPSMKTSATRRTIMSAGWPHYTARRPALGYQRPARRALGSRPDEAASYSYPESSFSDLRECDAP